MPGRSNQIISRGLTQLTPDTGQVWAFNLSKHITSYLSGSRGLSGRHAGRQVPAKPQNPYDDGCFEILEGQHFQVRRSF